MNSNAATECVAWLVCDSLSPVPLRYASQLSVGRTDDCDIVLPDKEVSRRHCFLTVDGTRLLCEDLGSTNGTLVNGTCVREAKVTIELGDVLTLGPYELRIVAGCDILALGPSAAASSEVRG